MKRFNAEHVRSFHERHGPVVPGGNEIDEQFRRPVYADGDHVLPVHRARHISTYHFAPNAAHDEARRHYFRTDEGFFALEIREHINPLRIVRNFERHGTDMLLLLFCPPFQILLPLFLLRAFFGARDETVEFIGGRQELYEELPEGASFGVYRHLLDEDDPRVFQHQVVDLFHNPEHNFYYAFPIEGEPRLLESPDEVFEYLHDLDGVDRQDVKVAGESIQRLESPGEPIKRLAGSAGLAGERGPKAQRS